MFLGYKIATMSGTIGNILNKTWSEKELKLHFRKEKLIEHGAEENVEVSLRCGIAALIGHWRIRQQRHI